MQSNDTEEHLYIIEGQSVKDISAKTNISEENIALLTQRDFEKLNRVKTLGFISIIERYYHTDLSSLREEAVAYYSEHETNEGSVFSYPIMDGRRPRSKPLIGIMLVILVIASWYFLIQYNKKHPGNSFSLGKQNGSSETEVLRDDPAADREISLPVGAKALPKETEPKRIEANPSKPLIQKPVEEVKSTEENVTQVSLETLENNSSSRLGQEHNPPQTKVETIEKITIVPVKRLWFGMIDMDTKKRKHYTVAEKFDIDVAQKQWLVATSPAPFSIEAGETKRFNDARAHYLKLDREGVKVLTREQYIALGGYPKW